MSSQGGINLTEAAERAVQAAVALAKEHANSNVSLAQGSSMLIYGLLTSPLLCRLLPRTWLAPSSRLPPPTRPVKRSSTQF